MGLRITEELLNALAHTPTGLTNVRFTGVDLQNLTGKATPRAFFTSSDIQVIARRPTADTTLTTTTADAQVLSTRTPIFTWVEMLAYEIFPTDIGYNSIGATRFATDVVVVDSGSDQRTARWDQPLMEYDITYAVRDINALQKLVTFFRTMRGRLNSFLFFDWFDHSSQAVADITAEDQLPPNPTDQLIGTGDGVTLTFQLQKTYIAPNGSIDYIRPITKPIQNSVLVAVNGTQVENFTTDILTGIVTFVPAVTYAALNGMALVPVLDGSGNPTSNIEIVSQTTQFANLAVGESIAMNGWQNAVNNNQLLVSNLIITAISPDQKTLTCSSSLTTWEAENNHNGVNLYTNPAPASNAVITAGYEFYVPVRFDTDKLPITLQEWGTGGASDVKLIEVRPYDL